MLIENMLQIDRLPLYLTSTLKLYNRYLLANISWNSTVSDIFASYFKENVGSIISKYICNGLTCELMRLLLVFFLLVISLLNYLSSIC